jgi:photosystem II stability/assembly factor-like uncharacterized protein
MRTPRALLATLVSLATLPAAAEAWRPLFAPPGGDVRALARAADPSTLYLGTAEGVLFRSDDAGLTWRRLDAPFPPGMSLDNILVTSSGDLFVGYWQVSGTGGGVARSGDGGRSWSVLRGIEGESVRALAASASDPARLVAGTLDGVFATADAGASWRRISPAGHAEIRNIESVAIDPTDPDGVYVGTWRLPWRTRDGGRSWQQIAAGMVFDSDVFTLTVDARARETLYATACTGIYRSRNAGGLWSKLRGIPASSRRTRAFAQDPDRPATLYAGTTEGLWASDDDGASWTLRSDRELVVNSVVPLPGGVVLLGCDGTGVLRSTDRGRSFAAANDGFSARFVARLLPDPEGARLLAAIQSDRQYAGVLTAPRAEGPWARLAPGLEGREVVSLAVAGRDVLAGTDVGLFRLVPGAASWGLVATAIGGGEMHPRVAEIVSQAPATLLLATDKGLLRSTDRGASWQTPALGPARSVSALLVSGAALVAATPLGLYRSQDAGATWSYHSAGPSEGRVSRIEGRGDLFFAATTAGLFRSQDAGRSWDRCTALPFGDIAGLALHANGRTVYAADFGRGGLYRSDDGGDTWSAFPTSGLAPERVWSLLIDVSGPGTLLAATASGGLHLLAAVPGGAAR